MNILFVCTGNTCRSAMAQAIAQHKYKEHNFFSAGLSASDGSPASKNAIAVLTEMGIDLCEHRAKQLTQEDVNKADLIVPMTKNHKSILEYAGVDSGKILYFDQDIKDPYGCDIDIYRVCANELCALIKKVCEKS